MSRVGSNGRSSLCVVCMVVAATACGGDDDSGSHDGAGDGGGAGTGGSPAMMPTTSPSRDGTIVQGHVTARDPLDGDAETFSAFVSGGYYDRCDSDAVF